MPFAPETVTVSGSGLVFHNSYGSNVNPTFRTTIIAAENFLQTHFTDAVTITVSFDAQPLAPNIAGENDGSSIHNVSYATLAAALQAHATSADDLAAVAGLPATDPSGGVGFDVPIAMARILGLAGAGNGSLDQEITLNSSLGYTYGADALGVLEHEITELSMGRVGGLGVDHGSWGPMDLFRFTAAGQRDYTGGRDGQATYFGIDSSSVVTQFRYHNSVSTSGTFDGFDLADWGNTVGDAFGPGGPSSPSTMSATDLRVMDILGWTPAGSSPSPTPPAAPPATTDDFANTLTDTSHPFGQVTVGGSATGEIESAGDRDWFTVQLIAGKQYTIDLQGLHAGGGTLVDPYLRLHDSTGLLLASNDDIVQGVNRDSQLAFTASASGTYYLEAGGFDDQYLGTYTVRIAQLTAPPPAPPPAPAPAPSPPAPVVPPDDFANSLTDTSHPFGQVSVGGSSTGSIETTADRDWFKVDLAAGAAYTIDLKGAHSGGGTLVDPMLRLHDSTGAVAAQNDNLSTGNADSQLAFTAATAGTYYLEAGAASDQGTGSYKLSLSFSDDFASSLSDTDHLFGQLAVGGSGSGKIDFAGDRDWFKIQLTAGQLYAINLQGTHGGGGTLADPYLRIEDGNGAQLAVNDNAGTGNPDAQLVYAAATSGTYYLVAGAAGDTGTGTYQLGVATMVLPSVGTTDPGRGAETSFDASYYRTNNQDVAAAGIDPQLHYDQWGWREGRNPDPVFNTSWYLQHNPDVAAAGLNPLLHFELYGWKEGRNPAPGFMIASYLAHNPDVALAGINPLDHYLLYGVAEHRPV
jgi:hypothetical protein